jgi:dipeptidase E
MRGCNNNLTKTKISTQRLLLVSNGFATENIKKVFLSSLLLTPSQVNVAIVPTASAEWKDKQKGAVAAYEYFVSTGFKKIDFIDIEFQPPELLRVYKLIYISGGNPCYLLWHLKHTGSDKILKELYQQGVYMVGSSGGAMIWGTDIRHFLSFEPDMNTTGLTDFSALACVHYLVLPHVDRLCQQYENYNEILHTIGNKINNDILTIGDNDGALFLGGVLQII